MIKEQYQLDLDRAIVQNGSYISFFYAFSSRPPFELVARSGYFCLGFASASSDGGLPNARTILTQKRPLIQQNETFDCPEVHYVSTLLPLCLK